MRIDKSDFRNLKNYIFGGTAAIITNISLIVGLGSARSGKGPILGALLTIALADNISDSLGIHMYKEAEGVGSSLSILTTALNFASRLLVSLSFVGIVLTLSVSQSIVAALVWGLLLLAIISYLITKGAGAHRKKPALEIGKHVLVAVVVIVISRYVGYLVAKYF